ncbi:ribonuclease T2 family protein [Photorhabdus namnaonensis]|uniref:Ribonuclease T2 family protein n=1 Tax=Photorhabdus namnaonensis TaxID=1851568 RepID=A0A1B8YN14_9GAMM|nr:ribonuclease [Photorhabdus namnaonensis]OCA56503.1 Ribonuclease T2 family protein [Photorhabdus namnaonensis]
MRFFNLLSAIFVLLVVGCAKQPEVTAVTDSLEFRTTLEEGASCILPATPPKDYDFVAKNDHYGQNATASTDYFKLAISYSPAFCKSKAKNIERLKSNNKLDEAQREYEKFELQCFSENKFNWVIHGLWAQTCNGKSMAQCRDWSDVRKHPRLCKGDLPQLDYQVIEPYLCASPGADLLQGEWEKHGVCAFATPEQFFSKQQELFDELVFPSNRPSNEQLIKFLQKNNPSLKGKTVQINRDELYICYSKNFDVIDCPKRE